MYLKFRLMYLKVSHVVDAPTLCVYTCSYTNADMLVVVVAVVVATVVVAIMITVALNTTTLLLLYGMSNWKG